LEQAQAALAEAEAAIKNAEIDLAYTEITAPISGRISRNLVSVGNLVGAGEQTLLTTIAQEDPIYVYINLSERLMLPILGQRARAGDEPLPEDEDHSTNIGLTLSDGTVFDGSGEFDYGDNKVDPDTGTIEVRAVFPNKNGALVPGMFVKVRVPEEKAQALLVPQEAVMRDMIGYYVLLVNDQNIVERRSVETGRKVEHLRIIESGLDPADRVVINGLLRARPGAEVKPAAGTILEPQGNQ
jgi:membrane fusion protein (multidrug efflux system)